MSSKHSILLVSFLAIVSSASSVEAEDVVMGSYDYTANSVVNFTMINCRMDNITDRTRWGVIATNFCKNILLEGCTLNRTAQCTFAAQDDRPRLKVATCQFPVSGDVDQNAEYIMGFVKEAAANNADIVHFSEATLSGYARVDFPSFEDYDWDKLRRHTHKIMELAKEQSVWIVLGSAHYLCPEEKPTNCLYVISSAGEIVDRYDKSMCTGGDLKAYTPGNHLVTIDLKGIRCGLLICYDSCFPEMYNVYRHRGVKVMLHSFYNARHEGKTILDEIIPAEIRVRASDNLMWVVANNSSAEYSSWPTCIARPDGSLTALKRGIPGILYRTFPDKKVTGEFRSWTHNNKSMVLPANEVYHNGTPSNHPRATNPRALP